jgi:hypothetical protein
VSAAVGVSDLAPRIVCHCATCAPTYSGIQSRYSSTRGRMSVSSTRHQYRNYSAAVCKSACVIAKLKLLQTDLLRNENDLGFDRSRGIAILAAIARFVVFDIRERSFISFSCPGETIAPSNCSFVHTCVGCHQAASASVILFTVLAFVRLLIAL